MAGTTSRFISSGSDSLLYDGPDQNKKIAESLNASEDCD